MEGRRGVKPEGGTGEDGNGHSEKRWGLSTWVQELEEKSVISLTEWSNTQGDSATDGGIRSMRHGRRYTPTRTVLDIFPHSVREIRF